MTRAKKPRSAEGELFLLIGLLYHGTQQSDGLVLRNICKDALERAHLVYKKLKRSKGKM